MLQPDLTYVDTPIDPTAIQLTLAFFEGAAEVAWGKAQEEDRGDRSASAISVGAPDFSPHALSPSSSLEETAPSGGSTAMTQRFSQPTSSHTISASWSGKAPSQEPHSRIYQLERALDQALICMEEMRQRVQDQELLETQLVATEQFASVQQQAIARLKLRLKQQQEQLRTQLLEAEARDRMVQAQLVAAESLVQVQQAELEQLRSYLAANQTAPLSLENGPVAQVQPQVNWATEAQTAKALAAQLQKRLEIAQSQVDDLTLMLKQAEARITDLEEEVQMQQAALEAKSLEARAEARSAQKQAVALRQPNLAIATLGQDLAKAQTKVEELEIELARQVRLQAVWQQGHQELAAAGDRYRSRIAELEQQIAEMQEQILLQVRQASEYETAVQHWKDRYCNSLRRLAQLQERLPREALLAIAPANSALQAALVELLDLLSLASAAVAEASSAASDTPLNQPWDVPDFLLWRRSHRR